MTVQELQKAFVDAYGKKEDAIYFSPGRVNLIGEHTDYNGGYVFPCALSFGTYLLIRKNGTKEVNFRSVNEPEVIKVSLDKITEPLAKGTWANYLMGVFTQFIKRGVEFKEGYDILIWGNVPLGAGLSSSAALEVVTAFALNDQMGTGYDRTELAKIGQKAEHEFAYVMCGIMDQFASAQGKKDHAIFLNCDTLEFELVPVKLNGIKVVISNTHSPHKLGDEYNDRVRECQLAVEQLRTVRPNLNNLAELTQAEFDEIKGAITDPIALKRARHVVGEVQRTVDAVKYLKAGDIETFGKLMNASHDSLRDDYEVTGKFLDTLAEEAWKIDGVIGSRMTGGGFGGCTVSLVKNEAIDTFKEKVGKAYKEKTGLEADFYIAEIGDGAKKI
ncbi:galactokinase [Paludibacter sp. 221]|uniref:galactokinase n=1 Tax=Paludibacter sp. 221 TaxID=2302939 RepID=UPI0013D59C2D|nr:galactokinase [Paludibacter sp. 221]NDV47747.1 galactokinase [Paludibacter sp. 221]